MSSDFVLQPEVEELLVDMAKQPGSTLLGIERPPVRTGYLETLEPASNVGSSAIERELLRVYREDVVFLLLHTALRSLHDEPPSQAPLDSRRSVSGPRVVWGHDELARRSKTVIGTVPHTNDLQRGMQLLTLAMEGRLVAAESAADTALALIPRPGGLQYKALALLGRDPHGALHAAHVAHTKASRSEEWSNILDTTGLAMAALGRLGESAAAYRMAASIGEPRTITLASWLTVALRSNDLPEAQIAMSRLDEAVGEDEASLRDYCQQQRRAIASARWKPEEGSNAVWKAVYGAAGPATRRVLDVLR